MGIGDFFKNLFKKKGDGAECKNCGTEAKKSEYGNTLLGKAMTKAANNIDTKVKAKTISTANAKLFKSKIDGLKPMIGKDEDTGLLQISQIIGSINRAR